MIRIGAPQASGEPDWIDPGAEARFEATARNSVVTTVALSIGMGVLVFGASKVLLDEAAPLERRLAIGTGLTVLLYVVVAFLVRRQLRDGRVRPDFAGAGDGRAIGVGLGVGLGGGALIVGLNSLVAGNLSSDPLIVALLYERAWLHVGVFMVIAMVAAPLVEELLFRGFLVESLRSKGRFRAVFAGAIGFSIWHLDPSRLRYYTLMGFFLGFLYWRFGINGSITAHAVFNATLVVFAFGVVGGPVTVANGDGVSVELPAAWRVVESDIVGFEVDVAAESPSGAAFIIQHVPQALPAGARLDPSMAAQFFPGARDVRNVAIGEGTGVRFTVDASEGLAAENVVTLRGSRIFVVTFASGGSAKAQQQFDSMLSTITFPDV